MNIEVPLLHFENTIIVTVDFCVEYLRYKTKTSIVCFARGSCKIKYHTFKDQYSVFSGVLVDFLREAVRAARVILFAYSTKVK